jgi:hypothetical protein
MRTIIVLLLLLAASSAAAEPIVIGPSVTMVPVFGAQAGWVTVPVTPPEWANRKYSGQLTITRTGTAAETRKICPLTTGYGCSLRDAVSCQIFIPSDEALATIGYSFEMVLAHELAHCAGWPPDHPGLTW